MSFLCPCVNGRRHRSGSTSKQNPQVRVVLLDKRETFPKINRKSSGEDVLVQVFGELDLGETAYFGLRYQDGQNQTHWLDPDSKVISQLKSLSSTKSTSSSSANNIPTLYLGVKFYAADPCRLREELTRYLFFLQVKSDVLQGRMPVQPELSVELAALALQSELGDYDPAKHLPGYVSEFRFASSQSEDMEEAIETAHKRLSSPNGGMLMSRAAAEYAYLEKVKWLDMYGVDLHPVIGEDSIEYFVGLTPSGIIILRNRNKVGNYFWPRIAKIYFKGRYFMLRVRDKENEESTLGFETPSRAACKHLWKCCVEHHAFFRMVQGSPALVNSGTVFRLNSNKRKTPGGRNFFGFSRNSKVSADLVSNKVGGLKSPGFVESGQRKTSSDDSGVEANNSMSEGGALSKRVQHRQQPQVVRISSVSSNSTKILNPPINSSPQNDRLIEDDTDFALNENGMVGSLHRNASYSSSQLRTTSSLPRNLNKIPGSNSRFDQLSPGEVSWTSQQQQHQYNNSSQQELSLQSLQWLESRGLFGSKSRRTGSMSERGSQINGYMGGGSRQHRSGDPESTGGHFQSDAESETSGFSSWVQDPNNPQSTAKPHHSRQHTTRDRSSRLESGSETESRASRRNHRGRRRRHGSYKELVDSSANFNSPGHDMDQHEMSHQYHRSRPSGYLNSGVDTESEMVSILAASGNNNGLHHSGSSLRRQRRRHRSRSRSPAAEARHRLPPELLKHMDFRLVEPGSEELKGDIPFTNVETSRPVRLSNNSGRKAGSAVSQPNSVVSRGRSRHRSGHFHDENQDLVAPSNVSNHPYASNVSPSSHFVNTSTIAPSHGANYAHKTDVVSSMNNNNNHSNNTNNNGEGAGGNPENNHHTSSSSASFVSPRQHGGHVKKIHVGPSSSPMNGAMIQSSRNREIHTDPNLQQQSYHQGYNSNPNNNVYVGHQQQGYHSQPQIRTNPASQVPPTAGRRPPPPPPANSQPQTYFSPQNASYSQQGYNNSPHHQQRVYSSNNPSRPSPLNMVGGSGNAGINSELSANFAKMRVNSNPLSHQPNGRNNGFNNLSTLKNVIMTDEISTEL